MTVALTKFKILQLAYGHIGKYINALTDLGSQGKWASDVYDLKLESALGKDYFPFANKTQQLSRLVDEFAHPNWQFIFELPADYITANFVIETNKYTIYEDFLLSNLDDVTLDYRFMPNSARFRADFTEYFVYELAVAFAINNETTQLYISALEKFRETYKAQAITSGAKAQPNRPITSNPFIDTR